MEDSSSCGLLDSEAFIRLVQGRPCLYDMRHANYKNRGIRQRSWLEIGELTWPDWDTFPKQVKEAKVDIIKKKWKSMKDAFIRHRRKEREFRSGAAASAPYRYIHADQMSFLIPCLEMRSTECSLEPTERPEEEPVESATSPTSPSCSLGPLSPTPPPPTSSTAQPPPAPPTPTTSAPRSRLVRRRSVLRPRRPRFEREENRLVEVLESMTTPLPMLSAEAHYLLSLEPKLKMVPLQRQSAIRAAINRVLDSEIFPEDLPHDTAPIHVPPIPQPPALVQNMHTHNPYPHTHTPMQHQHHPSTWHPRLHSPYVYPSTSLAHSSSTYTQQPAGCSTSGMREDIQVDEPNFELPNYRNL